MTYWEPARTVDRRTRSAILTAVVAVSAVLIGVAALLIEILPGAPEPAAVGIDSDQPTTEARGQPTTTEGHGRQGRHDRRDRRDPTTRLGEADGAVPDGVTVFDDDFPAVANLDPALLGALRKAATGAADDEGEFFVNSGWRSPEYQNQLRREAVSKYGSEEEAARWVATPETSLHVSGDAVDVEPSDATAWLSEHGAEYGLCQIYSNEPWHYELRPEAIDHGCPPMYADPTQDPRMQQ
ncbi:M15 family metallopeptidase [Streptosporangium amethystogenes]|uniref:M15 family metallopeptidase n=1 Tax=Streptosporangium amethystogenes TaxID=2002 RepID=UPI0037A572E3